MKLLMKELGRREFIRLCLAKVFITWRIRLSGAEDLLGAVCYSFRSSGLIQFAYMSIDTERNTAEN